MPEIAFLFPGQGSQSVGMAGRLAFHPEAARVFQEARRILGFDLLDLCLHGPAEELNKDLNAQLAVHTVNCAYAAALAGENISPVLSGGFSLGLFSSLVAAGSLTFEQGLEGVRMAAERMSEEGRDQDGAMAAIIGLEEETVKSLCRETPEAFLASVNTARQVVISGRKGDVIKAMGLCQQKGALLTKLLPIGWAIHTPLMAPVSSSFAGAIRAWEIRPPRFPVLGCRRAESLRTPEEIREELSAQFSHPNRWHDVLLRMVREGIDLFVEVGPGNVLSRMVRWVSRQARIYPAEEIIEDGCRHKTGSPLAGI